MHKPLKEIISALNEEIALRPPNQNKVEEYAERMAEGVKFPAVVVGRWPKSDKYGEIGIVDGLHRVLAAKKAKLDTLDVETKEFPNVESMLAYMYTANMAHGLPPTEGQRNNRIKLIKKIDPNATLEKLAAQFKLSKSSIDRILKDQQSDVARAGSKTGPKKSAAHKNLEPLSEKAFFSLIEKLNYTLERVRPAAAIVAYVTPESKEGVKLDTEKRDALDRAYGFLGALLKEIGSIKTGK